MNKQIIFQRNKRFESLIPFFKFSIKLFIKLLTFKKITNMDFIRVADFLRCFGFLNLSLLICNYVLDKKITRSEKFWCLQVKGTALQYLMIYPYSNIIFKKAIIVSSNDLEKSFSLQHFGKSQVEQGKFYYAKELFLEALIIRKKSENQNLINSTEKALKELESNFL